MTRERGVAIFLKNRGVAKKMVQIKIHTKKNVSRLNRQLPFEGRENSPFTERER